MSEVEDTGFDDVIAGEVWSEAPSDCLATIEADIVTATVTNEIAAAEEPGLSSDGKQALKSLLQLPALGYAELARLARDVAMDIKERHVVLADHKLTEAQYDYLEKYNEFYLAALKAACVEWHAPLSTQERIKIEAAAILEDSLPGLGARLQNRSEGLPGVVEAAKLFAKIASVGEREAGAAAPGERFTINIDLGGDTRVSVSAQGQASAPAQGHPGGQGPAPAGAEGAFPSLARRTQGP